MDFNTALGIIRRDMEEARALLDQLSELPGKHIAELELARSRMRSASELLAILPKMLEEKEVVKDKTLMEEKVTGLRKTQVLRKRKRLRSGLRKRKRLMSGLRKKKRHRSGLRSGKLPSLSWLTNSAPLTE